VAEVRVRFMPFQLYPQLPSGYSNPGQQKDEIFGKMIQQRAPEMTRDQRLHRADGLKAAWAAEGLKLKSPPTGLNEDGGGMMGSSFDAQRLIMFAREEGREDQMIEAIYSANHEQDLCLSDWGVLMDCARKAGLSGAEKVLESEWGVAETVAKIEHYKAMGLNSVPVLMLDAPFKAVLANGAPEQDFLEQVFGHILQFGTLPWQPAGGSVQEGAMPLAAESLLGAQVILNGLVSKPELNGMIGECLKFDANTGRVGVRLSNGQILAIRPGNLLEHQIAAPTEPDREAASKQLEEEAARVKAQEVAEAAEAARVKAQEAAEAAKRTDQQHAQRQRRELQSRELIEQLSMDMPWLSVPDSLHQSSLEDIQRYFDSDGELVPPRIKSIL